MLLFIFFAQCKTESVFNYANKVMLSLFLAAGTRRGWPHEKKITTPLERSRDSRYSITTTFFTPFFSMSEWAFETSGLQQSGAEAEMIAMMCLISR